MINCSACIVSVAGIKSPSISAKLINSTPSSPPKVARFTCHQSSDFVGLHSLA
jgi:hypothetical protein